MLTLFRSFAMCFSMYSRIPMPRVNWEKGSMRYVFCFFPLIGLVIGVVETGWYLLASHFHFQVLLYAAVAALIPVLITGGIHLDGYLDTCDAMFSYGDKEKKLEIMKDPRAGAFAVIYCTVYLIAALGLFAQIYQNASLGLVLYLSIGYLLSRCICGIFTVSMPCARSSGLAHMFQNASDKKAVRLALIVWTALCLAGMFLFAFWNTLLVIFVLVIVVTVFGFYCKKQFDGITGDLAGFILQIAELMILASALFMFPPLL